MIKVEHTKTITTYEEGIVKTTALVTDAKLVLVESHSKTLSVFDNATKSFVKPILISQNEKIEKGDAYYNIPSGRIYLHTYDVFRDKYSGNNVKILVLPEHFSPQQLQMIVDGKLKDGDKVFVECEDKWVKVAHSLDVEKSIKLNPHITIYPVEEKMYTFQDMDELRRRAIGFGASDLSLNKWFEQKVRK